MKIFYGAAIQGCQDMNEWAPVHRALIEEIKKAGHNVIAEHTAGSTRQEKAKLLEQAFGPLPSPGIERTVQIRSSMIRTIEGDIDAAVFEVSVPSLGTGVEIAHAYLRPRMGLPEIPVLALYKKGYWHHDLSSMIRGITREEVSSFSLEEYVNTDDARHIVVKFINDIVKA